ncbi:MAG: efflux RND transporter periplasmic adaptor subunit [Calditrichaeota bacterium]|nr:efflux RND transporter periplasmic adaptor subunit [Calditrichota bacterium]
MRVAQFLGLLLLAVTLGCRAKQEAPQERHLPVQTVRVTQAVFYRTYRGYGKIQSSQATDLVAHFDGIIRLNLKRNNHYTKGEWIFTLSGPSIDQKTIELQANLKAAEEQFRLAKMKLQRRAPLNKQELLSKEHWQELQADVYLAKQSLKKAKSDWNFFRTMTRYLAPYEGTVSGLAVSQGDYIRAGTPVAHFLGVSRLKLVANFFGDPTFLKKSRKVTVVLNDSLRATGRVIFQSRAVEAETGGHQLWIELDSLKSGLVPDMFVKFRLQFDGHRAPAVPEEALVREGSRYFVVVRKKGVYKNQPVKIGKRNGAFRELIQGPPVGTWIVITGAFEYFYKNLGKTMNVAD